MKTKTYEVKIHIGGNVATIEEACRLFCVKGLCVSVTPTTYIYTGGAETGACVGLINYPRFASEPGSITAQALALAEYLMTKCCQRSCSVITPEETHYLENREITLAR